MCVNDWRLGLQISSVITTFTLTVSERTFPANRNRIGIEIRQQTDGITGPLKMDVDGVFYGSLLQGLDTGTGRWSITTNGDLPTKSWRIFNTAGTANVTVVEYFLPTGIIASGLEEFQRQYYGSGIKAP